MRYEAFNEGIAALVDLYSKRMLRSVFPVIDFVEESLSVSESSAYSDEARKTQFALRSGRPASLGHRTLKHHHTHLDCASSV